MLVLTRKSNERLHIGDNVTITILRVKGRSVRIGIDAPREVRVTRGELAPLDGPTAEATTEAADEGESPAGSQQPPNSEVSEPAEAAEGGLARFVRARRVPGRRKLDRLRRDSDEAVLSAV